MKLRVILLNPKEEGNVGSVARVMKNFGLEELFLVNPCELGSNARRFASHGRDVLKKAKVVDNLDSAIKSCDFLVGTTGKKGGQKTPQRLAMTPEQLAARIEGEVGLLFGNESYGLKNKELDRCDAIVRIPSNPKYPVLNLSQSVGIILYEISKRRYQKTVLEPSSSAAEREAMKRYIDELIVSVYDQEHRQERAKSDLDRILGKAFLTKRETNSITSVARKALAKIRK